MVAGVFEGNADVGGSMLVSAGGRGAYVAKFDGAGNVLWSKRFGGPGNEYGRGIAVDGAGDVIVSGQFMDVVDFGGGPLGANGRESGFLLKLDPAGDHVWSTSSADKGLLVQSVDGLYYGENFMVEKYAP